MSQSGYFFITNLFHPFQVHQRQTERMRHRSEWFLSDPSGLVTVKCKTDRNSLTQSQLMRSESKAVTNQFHVTTASCDKPPIATSTPPRITPHPQLPTPTPIPIQQGTVVSLRRRLSDKDKERRLVRRSSSKRKDKENGGKDSPHASGGSGSARASSEALVGAIGNDGASLGVRPFLRRTGSADGSGGAGQHPMLCRTGSQDTPHLSSTAVVNNPAPATPPLASTGSDSPITRSLPRI